MRSRLGNKQRLRDIEVSGLPIAERGSAPDYFGTVAHARPVLSGQDTGGRARDTKKLSRRGVATVAVPGWRAKSARLEMELRAQGLRALRAAACAYPGQQENDDEDGRRLIPSRRCSASCRAAETQADLPMPAPTTTSDCSCRPHVVGRTSLADVQGRRCLLLHYRSAHPSQS